MLAQRLRACPWQRSWNSIHRSPRVRQYNVPPDAPHTTYFQPPPQPPKPPRRIFRTILWSSACFTFGALTCAWLIFPLDLAAAAELEDMSSEEFQDVLADGTADNMARASPALTLEQATRVLEARASYSIAANSVGHTCQVPSNLPCEDAWSSGTYTLFNDPKRDWCEWSVFDGHAGPRTSDVLRFHLSSYVGAELWRAKCMDKPYAPNDWQIINTIKRAFLDFDRDIVEDSARLITSNLGPRTETIAAAAAAFSGSCALMALFDPAKSILRVANVGDSRAVLGRWDEASQAYVAKPLSVDQKGFDQDEAARIHREHPGEDVVDPNTGRVHGIAVTRAFGDARWKWPEAVTRRAHELFWGPLPRPHGVIKTPPYLTAEPEIMETQIHTGAHPDFLILGSDGLWDLMSSEHAVACVQLWLATFKPADFLATLPPSLPFARPGLQFAPPAAKDAPTFPAVAREGEDNGSGGDEDEETYYDDVERARQWRVSPKHFVVEDTNCGVHLVKNALGGKRRALFTSVLSVQPPLSRNMRDDITVQVIFFGTDTEPISRK